MCSAHQLQGHNPCRMRTSPPDRSLVVHGGRGCWVVRHADATVTTEAADWITTHYEQVPPADADAHALTNRIVEQWQHDRCKADGFQIASEEELFGYLLRIFTRRRHERDSSNVCAAMVKFRSRGARTVAELVAPRGHRRLRRSYRHRGWCEQRRRPRGASDSGDRSSAPRPELDHRRAHV